MAAAPSTKPLSMVEGRLPAAFIASKPSLPILHLPYKPLRLPHLSGFRASPTLKAFGKRQPRILLVAQTSEWPVQEEEENEVQGVAADEQEGGSEAEASLSDVDEGGQAVATSAADGGFSEAEESYPEPPEEAKLFVGNIPYDMDSEQLAHLFEQAGVVEVAEVIYNRETEQSRGFGFVTMSTVEEAEKAVEMFHRYESSGRVLTVNKASPRGARVERTFELSSRIYVGNLPWQVDDSRLEQVFSEYGKVLDARVVYDRESGRSRGFGFVKMASQGEMDDAIAALDGQSLDGRALRVNVAEERPRRGSFA